MTGADWRPLAGTFVLWGLARDALDAYRKTHPGITDGRVVRRVQGYGVDITGDHANCGGCCEAP